MEPTIAAPTSGDEADFVFERSEAIQFEFYIPRAMLQDERAIKFLSAIQLLEPGATLFPESIGAWREDREKTCIVRIIVRASAEELAEVERRLAREIDDLMRSLHGTPLEQTEFLFTESRVVSARARLRRMPPGAKT